MKLEKQEYRMPIGRLLKNFVRSILPSAVRSARAEYKAYRTYRDESYLRSGTESDGATIIISGDWAACEETRILFQSLCKAIRAETKLTESILSIEGMSGRKYRMLINEIIGSLPKARYLEIGSWAGSTACSAMYGNRVEATCIDNWSEFGGPKTAFLANTQLARGDSAKLQLIESDFRAVDYGSIGSFNAYLFDGPHREQDQYDGIRLVQPALDDIFILVVDDWNFLPVRLGTLRAMEDEQVRRLFSIEIRSTQDNSHPANSGKGSDWHNGYCLCVCRKSHAS